MRIVKPRLFCLFIAAAVFVLPLIIMADDCCRCPDCARRTCPVKSETCPAERYRAETGCCCDGGPVACRTSEPKAGPLDDAGTPGPGHKAPGDSSDCRCGTYLCYDGNALLPPATSNVFSSEDEFYRLTPGAFAGSGWVHKAFHPPR